MRRASAECCSTSRLAHAEARSRSPLRRRPRLKRPGAWTLPNLLGPQFCCLNSLPLISILPLISPIGWLFFAGVMSRLTSSPALKVFLLHPLPAWVTGFHASSTQCCTVPVSSLASTFTSTCGFDQTYSVTVPFTVTVLPESKEAAPWWASSETE